MNKGMITLLCLGLSFGSVSDSVYERILGDYIQEGRAILRSSSKRVAAAFSDKQCYQCGCCCKEMPCRYGVWDEAAHQCLYLEIAEEFPEYTTYRCSQYDKIVRQEANRKYPMFGGGCGRPLLNPERDKIKQHLG